MSEARDLTDLAAQLDAVVAENRAVGARLVAVLTALRAMQAEHDDAEQVMTDAVVFPEHDLIAVHVAAKRFGIEPDTIRQWCRTRGIGKKHGGRWVVSCSSLRTMLGY